jgi:hypothetical protein
MCMCLKTKLARKIFAAAGDMKSAGGWEGHGIYKVFAKARDRTRFDVEKMHHYIAVSV